MKNTERQFVRARTVVSLVALALLAVGCAGKKDEAAGFATPEAAVAALVAALEKDDTAALARLLGPGTEDLLSSGDPVADKTDRADFLASYKAKNSLAADGVIQNDIFIRYAALQRILAHGFRLIVFNEAIISAHQ